MKFAALFLAAFSMQAAELTIDHVTVAGVSLANLQQQLAAVGIQSDYGGAHTNHATEMAIASFRDGSYLELIARQKDFDRAMLAQHPWAKFIEGDAGPCAWAVRPKDFDAQIARLKAAGPTAGGRKRPDGVALQWQTASVGSEPSGTFFPFLIHDVTARDLRAYPSGKAINRDIDGVLRVVIAVRKIDDAFDRFQRAYPGIPKPLRQLDKKFGAELAWIPDTPIVFAAPVGGSWIGDRIDKFGEGPVAFVLSSHKKLKGGAWFAESWFGRDISWFDPQKLGGWWLGLQASL
ncbi:VOC family protein [Nevskia soli]|uniref:VOC family protein n=1 Tax=Nevskia soli TaxID=418856 RepID=UPI0015D83FE9|nr:VOC family protein [Nevskia soli]